VVILDRNRPIAQIQPLSPETGAGSARLSELEASGLISRPKSGNASWVKQLQSTNGDVSGAVGSVEALIEERDSGR
jgi:antitoxin (DNA-binding transcriptional repressor) of toxin-antitoxin stability system